jgi:crotonobetaine/carnitine-CoA ligase
VHAEVRRWADAFRGLGVEAGDTVLTMLPNSFEAYFAWLGLGWLRAIEVPVNTMYRGQMLQYIVENTEAATALVAERFVDRLSDAATAAGTLKNVVVPDDAFFRQAATGDDTGPDAWDVAAMLYTSGTTGPSKGVLVPWAEVAELVDFLPDDFLEAGRGYYSAYPAFHLSGKAGIWLTASAGGHIVLRETFSPSAFLDDVRAHDCLAAALVGPMAAMLAFQPERPDDAATPMRHMAMGPLIPGLKKFSERFGVRICTGYGMSEIGAPLASGWDLADGASCGRRRTGYPGYEVRIVDEHDYDVPRGTVGELVVRSSAPWVMMRGYWKMPEKSAEAWHNGWFHTGDAFREDDDGNFTFVDRLKDAIRRRGENISSFEVEAMVQQHPAVAECAVVGVPSELGEDDVKVCVVLAANVEQPTPQELVEWLIPRMPSFMVPRYVEYVAALPKTDATQRTRKMELREDPVNEQTWDREKAGVVVPR